MKQFELCALGLQELDAKEQLETTGGEVFAFLAACAAVITIFMLVEEIYDNRDKIAELFSGMEEFKMTIRSSMYIREANVEKQNGLWCFEHKGEKKYYKPGKIEKVERGDDVTTFDYEEDRVVAHVMRKKRPVAEIIYSLNGAPVSGRIFENGKPIRTFKYNELGQVV